MAEQGNKFTTYLFGRQFNVETDHGPVEWPGDHQHNARVARLTLALQPFYFIVDHRRGRENVNADVFTAISPLYKLIWPLRVRIRGN